MSLADIVSIEISPQQISFPRNLMVSGGSGGRFDLVEVLPGPLFVVLASCTTFEGMWAALSLIREDFRPYEKEDFHPPIKET